MIVRFSRRPTSSRILTEEREKKRSVENRERYGDEAEKKQLQIMGEVIWDKRVSTLHVV
jgi:hypothetical protein